MEIRILTTKDEYWNKTIEASEKCSWPAGVNLAEKMRNNEFSDFEYPVVAIEEDRIVGLCCLLKQDFIPNCSYSPWISFIFVDEEYRGNRISQQMINKILDDLNSRNFSKIYICTSESNLYEKYGFSHIDTLKSYADTMAKVLMLDLLSI